jgi:dTDP-4-amino-4,6-dideoxygalactose transaminase
MVDLAARHRRHATATEAAVLAVLRSGRWIGGPVLAEAEARLAVLFGRVRGVGVANGTDAVALALQALGVGPGHEVLVPALSFFATGGAVARIGARPVVVDVLPDRPVMDPQAAHRALTARTRAAVPVHLFGLACPDPGLPVPLVEDAAQAVGQTPPARLGVLTAVSFYPTKTLGAAGDAGLVATDDDALAEAVRRLGGHGAVPGEPHLHTLVAGHPGGNSRLDPLQAAVLLAQIDDLPRRTACRRAIAARYDAALPAGFSAPARSPADPVHQYLLRGSGRDALAHWLQARGVECAIYYPRPLSAQPALQPQATCPVAEAWCRTCLSLPCHEELSAEQVATVEASLQEFAP